jgi:predicted porin
MTGGLTLGTRKAALLAATGLLSLGTAPVLAADLGGNCCADLEERIAELEATTARKGNRKVSLTVSGWVNQAVFFWDDGFEQNAYVGTNDLEQDRFRFTGEAKIKDGWSAGYILEIGLWGANSSQFNQDTPGGAANNTLTTRKSAWFIKSKDLGKVTVGKFDTATYHLIDNVDTLLTRNVSDFEAGVVALGQFKTRFSGVAGPASGPTWNSILAGFQKASPGQDALRNIVRYDTPTFAGFTASAAWGEDDIWDVALNYRNTLGDFVVNGAVGYGESTDQSLYTGSNQLSLSRGEADWWGIGALVQHKPTGLYAYGGYGSITLDLPAAVAGDDESDSWYIQGGVERKFFDLGKTNVFAEYRNNDSGRTVGALSSDVDFWAGGVAQNFESAELTLYAVYRHYEGEIVALTAGNPRRELEDFDIVITGGKINF